MEVVQQDQEAITQPGAHGKSHMANDGDESAETQAGRGSEVSFGWVDEP